LLTFGARKKFAKFAFNVFVNTMDNKTRVIGIRVEESVFQRLAKLESETGMEKVSLARTALVAVLEHYESSGQLVLPLKIVSGGRKER
jgi:hypothetical protein